MILFFLILKIFAQYIVQTSDNNLHFISDNNIEKVRIFSLETPPPEIKDEMENTDSGNIIPSNKIKVDSIQIKNDGHICFNNVSFSIDSLIDAPKIIDGLIFQTDKKCFTNKVYGVIIFYVKLDLFIIDIKTLYTRKHSISYIYYPFSSDKNMTVKDSSLFIDGLNFQFESKIVAVYSTKEYRGNLYMNRIYSNTNLVTYAPTIIKRETRNTLALIMIPIIIIFSILILKSKKSLRIEGLQYKRSSYTLYNASYNNDKILVKKYKRSYKNFNEEIDILKSLYHSSIPRLLGYEDGLFGKRLLFENSLPLNNPEIKYIKEIVDAVIYLKKKDVTKFHLSPQNIRIRNGVVKLFDIGFYGDYESCWCLNGTGKDHGECVVLCLGVLIHYFITGYHPFDLSVSDSDGEDSLLSPDNNVNKENIINHGTKSISPFLFLCGDKDLTASAPYIDTNNVFKKLYNENILNEARDDKTMQSDVVLYENNMINGGSLFKAKLKNNIAENQSDDGSDKNNVYMNSLFDNNLFPVQKKQYNNEDFNSIAENLLINRYLIRCKHPLCHDIIYHTIKRKVDERISLHKLSKHPFFWSKDRVFTFLANYSDLLEGSTTFVKRLERNKKRIFTKPWNTYIDKIIEDEISVFRIYNYNSAKDLIRVIRNKGRHYNQIPEVVKNIYGNFNGFIDYWLEKFPWLLIVCYNCGESFKENELLEDFY